MKNFFAISAAFAAILLTVNFAQAQSCSTTEDSSLATCIQSGVDTCRAASTCSPLKPALTVLDVQDLAIDTCCAKRSKVARRLCLNRERDFI